MTKTLAILGCGNLGTAILSGILSSLKNADGFDGNGDENKLSGFIACVRRSESANRIKKVLGTLVKHVRIIENHNREVVSEAEYIILGCKPYSVGEILQAPGIAEALAGKVLISICAGVTVSQIKSYLPTPTLCHVVRAMPNTASAIQQSMTVIEIPDPPLSPEASSLITWIFTKIGSVSHLPPSLLDTATALCGSGPAFFALVLEAIIDGAVATGMPRAEATLMAAQTMKGTAGLVLGGEHPAVLKDKVSSPGGCTIGGLLILEEGTVRGTMAKAVREATVIASQLGKGVRSVNKTSP